MPELVETEEIKNLAVLVTSVNSLAVIGVGNVGGRGAVAKKTIKSLAVERRPPDFLRSLGAKNNVRH